MARPMEGLQDRLPRIPRRWRLGPMRLPPGWNGQGQRDQKRARLLRPLVPEGLEGRPLPPVRVSGASLRSRRAVEVDLRKTPANPGVASRARYVPRNYPRIAE